MTGPAGARDGRRVLARVGHIVSAVTVGANGRFDIAAGECFAVHVVEGVGVFALMATQARGVEADAGVPHREGAEFLVRVGPDGGMTGETGHPDLAVYRFLEDAAGNRGVEDFTGGERDEDVACLVASEAVVVDGGRVFGRCLGGGGVGHCE